MPWFSLLSGAYGDAPSDYKVHTSPSKIVTPSRPIPVYNPRSMSEPVSAVAESLPEQEICREALLEKYAKGKERTVAEVRARVARALAAAEPQEKRAHWEQRFLEALDAGFIPAGR